MPGQLGARRQFGRTWRSAVAARAGACVYPNFGGGGTTITFTWPPTENQIDFYGTGWSGNKVLWWVVASYRGPVLIRGGQLDGPDPVRFEIGRPEPPKEMRIAALPSTYSKPPRDRPSYTRVRVEGCYAYQMDGTTFSRTIVFQARRVA